MKSSEAMSVGWEKRSLAEAHSELCREIQIRERCFPRWVGENRLTLTEAKDRLQRMQKAAEAVGALADAEDEASGGLEATGKPISGGLEVVDSIPY